MSQGSGSRLVNIISPQSTITQNLTFFGNKVFADGISWGHARLRWSHPRDIPSGPVDKTLSSQCKEPRFNSWSGN